MPMKGRFPIRRTLKYLSQGNVVFKDAVKVMTVNYNTHGELGEGARKFVFFNIPQIQYKNPWVQIVMFKNMTPTPFLQFYLGSCYVDQAGLELLILLSQSPECWDYRRSPTFLRLKSALDSQILPRPLFPDSGEQVLVDMETKSNKEIMEHIRKILGKSEETLRKEEQEKQQQSHPANFGPRKYCLRECMCEVEGQVPCPSLVPLPKEMTGKYKAALRASAQD